MRNADSEDTYRRDRSTVGSTITSIVSALRYPGSSDDDACPHESQKEPTKQTSVACSDLSQNFEKPSVITIYTDFSTGSESTDYEFTPHVLGRKTTATTRTTRSTIHQVLSNIGMMLTYPDAPEKVSTINSYYSDSTVATDTTCDGSEYTARTCHTLDIHSNRLTPTHTNSITTPRNTSRMTVLSHVTSMLSHVTSFLKYPDGPPQHTPSMGSIYDDEYSSDDGSSGSYYSGDSDEYYTDSESEDEADLVLNI